MLLLFFFLPQSCATASDLRKRNTPSVRSSHLIRPGFVSGFSKMSLMNSHRCVPRGAVGRPRETVNSTDTNNSGSECFASTYCVSWWDHDATATSWHLGEIMKRTSDSVLWLIRWLAGQNKMWGNVTGSRNLAHQDWRRFESQQARWVAPKDRRFLCLEWKMVNF